MAPKNVRARAALERNKGGGDKGPNGPHQHTVWRMAVNMEHLRNQGDIDPEQTNAQRIGDLCKAGVVISSEAPTNQKGAQRMMISQVRRDRRLISSQLAATKLMAENSSKRAPSSPTRNTRRPASPLGRLSARIKAAFFGLTQPSALPFLDIVGKQSKMQVAPAKSHYESDNGSNRQKKRNY